MSFGTADDDPVIHDVLGGDEKVGEGVLDLGFNGGDERGLGIPIEIAEVAQGRGNDGGIETGFVVGDERPEVAPGGIDGELEGGRVMVAGFAVEYRGADSVCVVEVPVGGEGEDVALGHTRSQEGGLAAMSEVRHTTPLPSWTIIGIARLIPRASYQSLRGTGCLHS